MLIFVVLVTIIVMSINGVLTKKYKIEDDYISWRHYSSTHVWVDRFLIFGFIILVIVGYFLFTVAELYIYIGYAILFFAYRTFMEFKYEREEKDYLRTLVSTIGLLVIFFGSIFYSGQIMAPYKAAESKIKMLDPESVDQIEIINYEWNEKEEDIFHVMKNKEEVIIEDKEQIDEIITVLSKVELRVKNVNRESEHTFYRLYINGDRSFEITVFENYLAIDTGDYRGFKVVGDNGLYQLLQNGEVDWLKPNGDI